MDNNDTNFKWPDCPPYPPPSWWEVRGTELGLEPDQVKFAAALVTLGGPDSRSNSMAASLAGMDLSRTEAFRLARSVKVRKLINEAEETKKGDRKPLSEAEIDQRIDKMIASPNDLAAAKGIELRDRRRSARKELSKDDLLRDRPDLFWAGWLERLGPKRGPAVVSLLGWYTSSGSRGTDAFHLAPFLDELLPHVRADWPDVFNFLVSDVPDNDWERKCFPEPANKPPKPVAEIVANVKARYERLDVEADSAA